MPPTIPPSPCVGICRIDEPSSLCLGCARSDAEIAAWRDLDETGRAVIWRLLPRRRAAFKLGFRPLPLSGPALAGRLIASAQDPDTVFAIGVQGAVSEFMRAADDGTWVDGAPDRLVVHSRLGALRLAIEPWVRAFAFGPEGGAPDEVGLRCTARVCPQHPPKRSPTSAPTLRRLASRAGKSGSSISASVGPPSGSASGPAKST